jgi:S-DNA-T family DNA segregation ATPase FtsK/SpoIIIE
MARARETHPPSHSVDEAVGLSLLGLGTLLFLALISYHPRDVPTWFPLHNFDPPNRHTLNFIGPVGAIFACTLYTMLGAASYLFTAVLLGFGGAKLLSPGFPISRRAGWAAAFVVSGACLADILPFAFIDASRMNLASEGGWIGKKLGHTVFEGLLGPIGATIAVLILYFVSLMLATGLRPLAVLRWALAIPGKMQERFTAWKLARADEQERLAMESEQIELRTKKLERSLKKRGASVPAAERERDREPEPEPVPTADEEFKLLSQPAAEPEPAHPAPQIIDANASSLAKTKAKKKVDKFQPLTPISSEGYELPSISLLDEVDLSQREAANPEELLGIQAKIIDTLAQFSIGATPGDITRGPTITRYEVYPAYGIRVDRIANLERDLARATRAERINILAPIPGKDTVGIEIANSKKQKVTLRELLEGDDFHQTKAKIPIALGKDVYGHTVIADLAAMPHLLVAGTTGSGKSVCINAIIASILYRFTPADLQLIMIDPKVVEMQMYNALPHLVTPVVTDPKKVLLALRWACQEMDNRYEIFAKVGVRNIAGFNARPLPKTQAELDAEKEGTNGQMEDGTDGEEAAAANSPAVQPSTRPAARRASDPLAEPEPDPDAPTIDFDSMDDNELFDAPPPKRKIEVPRDADELIIPDRMPYLVIIVDELADLMQTAPADVESAIARLTQKARAAGIHLIIATQTPRADVITGVIKANVPCRIAFQVSSPLDSRVILDENGAERLLGQGDMLYRPPGTAKMVRSQGVLVTDEEVQKLVHHASSQQEPQFENPINERLSTGGGGEEEEVSDEDEELVQKCIEVMRQEKKASTSLFQRRLRLGYTRAARILDILEQRGFVGAGEGAKPREILKDLDAL